MDLASKNKLRSIDYEERKFILAVVGAASGILRTEQVMPISRDHLAPNLIG